MQLIVKLGSYRNYIFCMGIPRPINYLFEIENVLQTKHFPYFMHNVHELYSVERRTKIYIFDNKNLLLVEIMMRK